MECHFKKSFIVLCIIHVLVWTFVLAAFLKKNWARLNLYIVIPIIYALHILPFHIITTAKMKTCNTTQYSVMHSHAMKVLKPLVIPYYFMKLRELLNNICLFSPISAQGMLIWGCISSAYRLR